MVGHGVCARAMVPLTLLDREQHGILDLDADPAEQQVDVDGRRDARRLLVVHTVLPQVLTAYAKSMGKERHAERPGEVNERRAEDRERWMTPARQPV